MKVPTNDEVIAMAKGIIQGTKDPVEVALWAESFDYPENQEVSDRLEKESPELRQFIDTLSLAGAVREDGMLLYTKADFQKWLSDFLRSLPKNSPRL